MDGGTAGQRGSNGTPLERTVRAGTRQVCSYCLAAPLPPCSQICPSFRPTRLNASSA